jgi:hypothetical protein
LAPGVVLVHTAADLRSALAAAATTVDLFLAPGRFDLGGQPLVVPASVNATLSSVEGGATLDGGWRSRIFEVHGALTLSWLHLTRGLAPNGTAGSVLSGGGAIAVGAGGSLAVVDSVVSSSATAATVVPALPLPFIIDGGPSYASELAKFVAVAQATGEHGGGIAVAANASAVLVRSMLTNLSAPVGGAISGAGRMTVQQGAVVGVSAIIGGGIAVTSAGELVLLEASISDALATADAGAVSVTEVAGTAMVTNSSIVNSHAGRVC